MTLWLILKQSSSKRSTRIRTYISCIMLSDSLPSNYHCKSSAGSACLAWWIINLWIDSFRALLLAWYMSLEQRKSFIVNKSGVLSLFMMSRLKWRFNFHTVAFQNPDHEKSRPENWWMIECWSFKFQDQIWIFILVKVWGLFTVYCDVPILKYS